MGRVQRELAEAQAGMTDEEREAMIEELSAELKRNMMSSLRNSRRAS